MNLPVDLLPLRQLAVNWLSEQRRHEEAASAIADGDERLMHTEAARVYAKCTEELLAALEALK